MEPCPGDTHTSFALSPLELALLPLVVNKVEDRQRRSISDFEREVYHLSIKDGISSKKPTGG